MLQVIAVALALMVIANMALILVHVGVPLRLLARVCFRLPARIASSSNASCHRVLANQSWHNTAC